MSDTRVLPRRLRTVSRREAQILREEAMWHLWEQELSQLPKDLHAPHRGTLRINRGPALSWAALKMKFQMKVLDVRTRRKCRYCLKYIEDREQVVAFKVNNTRAFIHWESCRPG